MSTDYTEEDVERVIAAIRVVRFNTGTSEDGIRILARQALEAIYPLAYTAGALAMKEAAIQSCEGRKDSVLFRGMSSDGQAATLCGAQAAAYDYAIEDIQVLPVPPRGSKI